ncbi:hypothetical protein HPB47_014874, partial [Ixodes persulcatus]
TQDCKLSQEGKDHGPSVVMTSVPPEDREVLCSVVLALGGFRVEAEVTPGTTHLVVGGAVRTLNLLSAMARGCWVLSTDWVYRSLEAGHWLDERPFELSEMFPAVRPRASSCIPLGESTPDLELAERIDLPKAPEPSPHPFSDVTPPSVFCTKIVLTNDPGALCFGWHVRLETGDVLVVKHVTFTECSEPVTAERAETSLCRIYCRNIKVDEFLVANESDALAALKKVDALLLCPGCDVEPLKSGQCTKFGTAYYAHTCCVTTAEGKQCLRCKCTRKLIANQMRRQKQQPKPKFRQRAARKSV